MTKKIRKGSVLREETYEGVTGKVQREIRILIALNKLIGKN